MNRLLPLTSLFCTVLLAMAVAAAEPPGKRYLFSYFLNNGGDGLHLAWSADGLKWQTLKNGGSFLTPSAGGRLMRDPCITTGPDGTFHMVWTDSWKGGTAGSPPRGAPPLAR